MMVSTDIGVSKAVSNSATIALMIWAFFLTTVLTDSIQMISIC
ncbi:MAG: hypothetical protein ACR2MG_11100 [Pyrinomonadaceae bacterium]